MFKTVVFDLDGTLLNTLQDLAAAGNHTLSTMGLPTHPENAYRKMVGSGIPKLIERMLPAHNRGESALQLAQIIFFNYYPKHMNDLTAPYFGIMPMLAALKQHKITLAILSNKDDLLVKEVVEEYFTDTFSAALGKREDFATKPDPASALYLLDILQADPKTTLYVGDSDVDMYTAKNAGLCSCGVLWGFRDKEELLAAGATHLAANTTVLLDLILGTL